MKQTTRKRKIPWRHRIGCRLGVHDAIGTSTPHVWRCRWCPFITGGHE